MMFQAVQQMRWWPAGKLGLTLIAVPVTLPLLLVAAMQIPIQTVVASVLKTLL